MAALAAQAEEHYREFLPTAYAAIPEQDREAFFQRLESEAMDQILDLAESLEGPTPEGETFEEKISRFLWARRTAESQIVREFLLPTPEPTSHPENETFETPEATADRMEFDRLRESLLP